MFLLSISHLFSRCLHRWLLSTLLTLWIGFPNALLRAQNLQVVYGARGVQSITYSGVLLEDVGGNPSDEFHIWHMRSTDLAGNVDASGQYGWGEDNNGESWNAATLTETYQFTWGSISTQFVQSGDNLDILVTESNSAGSNIIFDGAEIYPFTLHFPSDPSGFNHNTQYAITTIQPGISVADFGSGIVTAVVPDESRPLYTGWKYAGANSYSPILTGTAPDGLATFLPHVNLPVAPGQTISYRVSLRFTPKGAAANTADAGASFAATYPSQLHWTDKRIIGTAYLASSAVSSNTTQPAGYPTNPRRYFDDATIDVTTPGGLAAFQARIIAQAQRTAANAVALNAQGVITWDIEGEQYPQSTSYVCSPDQIATVAPEMESIITSSAAFNGKRLDDVYFDILSAAGLRTGVCLRPQVFTFGVNDSSSQVFLSNNPDIIANIESKARFANSRWGVSIFYVDSTVDVNGGTLDPAIFQQINTDLPGFLFIPEESTPRYYAYTAPFYSFLFHDDLGTPASIHGVYPNAFGANLINDVSAATLATYTPQLTASVAQGDILMGHADYWQANDPALIAIYATAGMATSAHIPHAAKITWNPPAPITYGTALGVAQLNAFADAPGSFTYSPPAGTTLSAGPASLTAFFTPANTVLYAPASLSVPLTVAQATPVLNWPLPAPLPAGSALSSTQLNATANVPGSIAYTPALGTPIYTGIPLIAQFTPTDSTDYAMASATVPLVVTAAPVTAAPVSPSGPLRILWPVEGTNVSGVIIVTGFCSLPLDAAGTFLMVDGQEVGSQRTFGPFLYVLDTTALSNGKHTVQLWAHDIGNNTTITPPLDITIMN